MQGDLEFDQRMVGRERRVKDLPTFYYHGHFVEMLDFVERHYAHVLDTEHRDFLEQFRGLSRDAQCLYVRLYNRKGRVFSSSRLNYPELDDLASLRHELVAGFLFVLVEPPLLLAQVLIWTYVVSRAAHFIAYTTAQIHDIRAFCWTWSSVSVIAMAIYSLIQAF